MAGELAIALERRPEDPGTHYDLACAQALVGHPEDALDHLRRALELRSEWADHAGEDEDLLSLRGLDGWPS